MVLPAFAGMDWSRRAGISPDRHWDHSSTCRPAGPGDFANEYNDDDLMGEDQHVSWVSIGRNAVAEIVEFDSGGR